MTENQRDYLADLALKKGVRLKDTDNFSVFMASAKIEELKTLPDAVFDKITEDQDAEINLQIKKLRKELKRWTFTR